MKIYAHSVIAFILTLFLTGCASTSPNTNFGERPDVQVFIQKVSQKDDFNSHQLTNLFNQVKPRPNFVQSSTHPKEKTTTWQEYRAIFITPAHIQQGVKFWNAHEKTLNQAQQQYGVDPAVIIGIIGVETDYGKYLGKYRVIDSLSTLAFDHPHRQAYFQHELEEYLLLTRDLNIDPLSLYGSYAGAVGLPQFMPSNYRCLAVSCNGKTPDLWNNPDDAILSVANYFKANGWREDLTLNQKIHIIMRYNDSIFYANAVYQLGQAVKSAR